MDTRGRPCPVIRYSGAFPDSCQILFSPLEAGYLHSRKWLQKRFRIWTIPAMSSVCARAVWTLSSKLTTSKQLQLPPKYSRVFYLFSILPPPPPHQTKHAQDPFAREISNAKRVAYIPEVDPQALPRRRKEWSPTNALLVGNWMIPASVPSERTFCDVV